MPYHERTTGLTRDGGCHVRTVLLHWGLGPDSISRRRFTKINKRWDGRKALWRDGRLISILGIPVLLRHLYIDSAPRWHIHGNHITVQIIHYYLFDVKSLPELKLSYRHMELSELWTKIQIASFKNAFWDCRLQDLGEFIQTSTYPHIIPYVQDGDHIPNGNSFGIKICEFQSNLLLWHHFKHLRKVYNCDNIYNNICEMKLWMTALGWIVFVFVKRANFDECKSASQFMMFNSLTAMIGYLEKSRRSLLTI